MAGPDRHLFRWRAALLSENGPSNPTMRHVLLTLSTHGDMNGKSIFPSTRTLAIETGLCRQTVMNALKEAEGLGWVQCFKDNGNGQGWKRHAYGLTLPERGQPDSPPSGDNVVKEINHDSGKGGQSQTERGQSGTRRGQPPLPDVVNEVDLISSVTSSENSSRSSGFASREEEEEEDDKTPDRLGEEQRAINREGIQGLKEAFTSR